MKFLNLSKLVLCALAVAASSVWAGSKSWNLLNYGDNVNYKSESHSFVTVANTQVNTSVIAWGAAYGVAVVSGPGGTISSSATSPMGYNNQVGDSDTGSQPSGSNLSVYLIASIQGAPGSGASSSASLSW